MNPRASELLAQRQTQTLAQIGAREGVSKQRIHQLTGNVREKQFIRHLLEVHAFIRRCNVEGHLPTYQEFTEQFPNPDPTQSRSSNTVRYWLGRMEELKLIAPRTSRSIRALKVPMRIRRMVEES